MKIFYLLFLIFMLAGCREQNEICKEGNQVAAIALNYPGLLVLHDDNNLWEFVLGIEDKTINILEENKLMDDIIGVAAGMGNIFVIKSDNSLWAWGSNFNGILGDGTAQERYEPVHIMNGAARVCFSGENVMVLTTDNSLWMWGTYWRSRLGRSDFYDIRDAHFGNTPVKIIDNVKYISSGVDHSMAVKMDGSLWVWGWVRGDSFFMDCNTDSYVLVNYPMKIMDNVLAVSTGGQHLQTIVVLNSGAAYAWGGVVETGGQHHTPLRVYVPGNIIAAESGIDESWVITCEGNLWAWNAPARSFPVINVNDITPEIIKSNVYMVFQRGLWISLAVTEQGNIWASWTEHLIDCNSAQRVDFIKIY